MGMSGRNLDIFQQKPDNPWIRIIHTIASRVVIKYARALSEMDPAGEGDKLQRININGIIKNTGHNLKNWDLSLTLMK